MKKIKGKESVIDNKFFRCSFELLVYSSEESAEVSPVSSASVFSSGSVSSADSLFCSAVVI